MDIAIADNAKQSDCACLAGCGVTELVKDIIMAAQLHLSHTRKPKAAKKALENFVNLRNGLGQTALELACKYGCVSADNCLLADFFVAVTCHLQVAADHI